MMQSNDFQKLAEEYKQLGKAYATSVNSTEKGFHDSLVWLEQFLGEFVESNAQVSDKAAVSTVQADKVKSEVFETMVKRLTPELKKTLAEDPSKAAKLVAPLKEMLNDCAADPVAKKAMMKAIIEVSKEYLVAQPENGMEGLVTAFDSLFDENAKEVKEGLRSLTASNSKTAIAPKTVSDSQNSGYGTVLAQAMMMMQEFQNAVTQSQSNQDVTQAAIGKMLIQSALDQAKKISDEIQKAKDATKHFGFMHWISVAIMIVATVVSMVVSPATTLVCTALILAYTQSPLMKMTVEAISTAIQNDLEPKFYQEFINEHKTPEEAHELAHEKAVAIGNIVGKVVSAVIIMVACVAAGGGVGGFMKSGVGFTGGLVAGAEAGVIQSIENLASSGIFQDSLMTNPEWVNKHPQWAAGIAATLSVVTAGLGLLAAFKMGNGASSKIRGFFSEGTLAKYAKVILKAQLAMGIVGGAAEIGFSTYQGVMLTKAANYTTALAEMEHEMALIDGGIQMNQNATKINNDTANQLIQSAADQMKQLFEATGIDIDQAVQAMA